MSEILFFRHEDIRWQFDDGKPFLSKDQKYGYWQHLVVDPFPCYSHAEELARERIAEVERIFPIGNPLYWYILPYEQTCRTNGSFSSHDIYKEEHQKECGYKWSGNIILQGKRIPIMPSMTRYLIGHEYGHFVERFVREKMGYESEDHTSRDRFLEEYMTVRGEKLSKEYGALKWHLASSEVFANDFRIIVCGAEIEFWPHPVSYPLKNNAIIEWWKEAKEKYL